MKDDKSQISTLDNLPIRFWNYFSLDLPFLQFHSLFTGFYSLFKGFILFSQDFILFLQDFILFLQLSESLLLPHSQPLRRSRRLRKALAILFSRVEVHGGVYLQVAQLRSTGRRF